MCEWLNIKIYKYIYYIEKINILRRTSESQERNIKKKVKCIQKYDL